jgi:DNA-binding protein H-NS
MNEQRKGSKSYDWTKHSILELEDFIKEIRLEIQQQQVRKKDELRTQFEDMAKAAGLTLNEVLGIRLKGKGGKKRVMPVKYRHPETGETWAGTGRKPAWLDAQLEAGKTLEDFAV